MFFEAVAKEIIGKAYWARRAQQHKGTTRSGKFRGAYFRRGRRWFDNFIAHIYGPTIDMDTY